MKDQRNPQLSPRGFSRVPLRRAAPRGGAAFLGWIAWIARASFAVAIMACGPAPAGNSEPVGSTSLPIYGGTIDDATGADGAVVAIRGGGGAQGFALCSGVLVAPNVVLTARHCVVSSVAPTVTCDVNGASTSGVQIGGDVDPTTLHVFTGARPNVTYGTPAANGKAIYDTESPELCNADIALLVLDRALTIAAPMRVRLKEATRAGEWVRAVGYGQNDQGAPVGTRIRRDGRKVLAVGAGISASATILGNHEMELGEASCNGDSGGPAISEETGAVIGIVSRAGGCGDDFGHVYTMTAGFASLLRGALASAGGEQPLDEQVYVAAKDGGAAPRIGTGGGNGNGNEANDGGGGGSNRDSMYTVVTTTPSCAVGTIGRAPREGERGSRGAYLALVGALALAAGTRRHRKAEPRGRRWYAGD